MNQFLKKKKKKKEQGYIYNGILRENPNQESKEGTYSH